MNNQKPEQTGNGSTVKVYGFKGGRHVPDDSREQLTYPTNQQYAEPITSDQKNGDVWKEENPPPNCS